MAAQTIRIKIEFGGGTELLLSPPKAKKHVVEIPAHVLLDATTSTKGVQPVVTAPTTTSISNSNSNGSSSSSSSNGGDAIASHSLQDTKGRPSDMRFLVQWMLQNMIAEREELFVDADGEGVRPGILVLINEADWELEGELDYQLQEGDVVCFISTLHGG